MRFLKKICFRPEWVVLVLLLLITNFFVWQKDNWQLNVLSSDGRGYYAYLPTVFLNQDFTYQTSLKAIEEELGYEMGHHYILEDEKSGRFFNKTFPGVAICQSPLFLLATFLSYLFGYELNGYNILYLLSMQMSAILSCVIGFYFLKRLLILQQFSVRLAILISFATVFATNVYFYATQGASMGHIHSFMAISGFLFFAQKSLNENKLKHYLLSTFFLCLIFLIRPTNILVLLLVPFLAKDWGNLKRFFTSIFKAKKNYLSIIALGISMIAILPILWYVQTGNFVVWSYTGEGFNFLKPLPHKVLFSFRNGMFIYAPFALLSLVGMIILFWKNKFQGVFAILFFAINIYIISSWWTFYYGGGFGHRAYTEHHVFTGLMAAFAVVNFSSILKKITLLFSVLCISLSLFQGFQMNKGILPPDYMNAEMYQLLFLKWDDEYIRICNATLDNRQYGEVKNIHYIRPEKFDSEPIVTFNQSREFGGDASFTVPHFDTFTHLFLEYRYEKMRLSENDFEDVFMVVSGEDDKGNNVFYKACNLYDIRTEAFKEYKPLMITLQIPSKNIHQYKFYIWNKGLLNFEVKNIDIRIMIIEP